MSWRKSLLGGVLASAVVLVACGGGGEESGDGASGRGTDTVVDPPDGPPPTQPAAQQERCTWRLVRAGGTVTGSCLGVLGYAPDRPLSTVEFAASSPAAVAVNLELPQVLTPGSYSFANSSLMGSVVVSTYTGAVYMADRSPGSTVQGAVTYDVLSVDNTSAGTVLQGRIQAEVVQPPFLQNQAQLTIDFSGLLR